MTLVSGAFRLTAVIGFLLAAQAAAQPASSVAADAGVLDTADAGTRAFESEAPLAGPAERDAQPTASDADEGAGEGPADSTGAGEDGHAIDDDEVIEAGGAEVIEAGDAAGGDNQAFNPAGAEVIESGATVDTAPSLPVRISGYIDLGAFRADNRGAGFIFDTGDRFSARYPGKAWVLLGDPLSTMVNSRAEPADTSGSLAFTDDPLNSEGALTFLVNEVNLELFATISPRIFAFASLDVLPRTGFRGTLGDHLDVDYAYVEFTPFDSWDLTFSAGKLDPAFGREYRVQESVDRPGVTPSLLFRYVGGHPIGLKARGRFLDQRLTAALAVTNGSSFIEAMQQADEIDRNDPKTFSGRLSWTQPLPVGLVEIGASGESGVQSRQTDPSINHWQVGADLYAELWDLELRGEFVRGIAEGGGLESADGLDYRAFFAEGLYRVTNWLGVVGRFEQRHALNWKDPDFVYLIHIQRLTGGVRFVLHPRVLWKLEYIHNMELDPLPSFANDVAATSLVVRF